MNRVFFCLALLVAVVVSSCNDDAPDQGAVFIPNVPVNITVNTDLPLHFHLKTLGSFSLLDGGHRGIILVHNFDDRFYALERTCTFEPDLDCSHIQIDTANIQLRCGTYNNNGPYTECCASKFSFDGNVLQNPARFPLRQYRVVENGSLLTIVN